MYICLQVLSQQLYVQWWLGFNYHIVLFLPPTHWDSKTKNKIISHTKTTLLTTFTVIVHSICIEAKAFQTGIYGNGHRSFGCYSNSEGIQVTRGDLSVVAQACSTYCSFIVTITILECSKNTVTTLYSSYVCGCYYSAVGATVHDNTTAATVRHSFI